MNELRIHNATDHDNSPDLTMAGRDLLEINADPRKWAVMEADIDSSHRIVKVRWGVIHSDGTRECAIQTIDYTLLKDGTVHVTKYTHP